MIDYLAVFAVGLVVGWLASGRKGSDVAFKLLEARTEVESLITEVRNALKDNRITREEFEKILERLEKVVEKLRE